MASDQNQLARALEYQERALAIEYDDLPDVVNLQTIRTKYGQLLGWYRKLTDAFLASLLLFSFLALGCEAPGSSAIPGVTASDKAAVSKGMNAFDLFHRLRGREGNLTFSPASINFALAMTYAGARGPLLRGKWLTVLQFFQRGLLHETNQAVIETSSPALREVIVSCSSPTRSEVRKGIRFLLTSPS